MTATRAWTGLSSYYTKRHGIEEWRQMIDDHTQLDPGDWGICVTTLCDTLSGVTAPA
jgi:hypothetical protein